MTTQEESSGFVRSEPKQEQKPMDPWEAFGLEVARFVDEVYRKSGAVVSTSSIMDLAFRHLTAKPSREEAENRIRDALGSGFNARAVTAALSGLIEWRKDGP